MAQSSFTTRVGCLAGAFGLLLMTAAPMASFAGERAPVAAPTGENRYSGRPIEADCHQYCLPPGYTLEQPRVPDADPVQGEWVHESPAPVRQDSSYHRSVSGGDAYSYQRRETGGYDQRQTQTDGYAWQASHEEGYGYEDGYAYQDSDDDRDDGYDDDRRTPACQPRYDNRGRVLQSCGEIRLSDGFFYGATGGVGPDYIDAGGGGGGGGIAYASAGSSAGASAYASARASVGVSIRIGGGRGGHPGKPGGGGHPGKGGCGCGH